MPLPVVPATLLGAQSNSTLICPAPSPAHPHLCSWLSLTHVHEFQMLHIPAVLIAFACCVLYLIGVSQWTIIGFGMGQKPSTFGQPCRHGHGWDELVIILNSRKRNVVTSSQDHKPLVLSKIKQKVYNGPGNPVLWNVLSGTSCETTASVLSSLAQQYWTGSATLWLTSCLLTVWLWMGESFQQLLSDGSNNSWNG